MFQFLWEILLKKCSAGDTDEARKMKKIFYLILDIFNFLKWRYSLKFFWNVREIVFIFDFTISVFILVFYQHIFFSPWILTQVVKLHPQKPGAGPIKLARKKHIYLFFLNLIFKSYISTSRLYLLVHGEHLLWSGNILSVIG